MNDLEIPTPSSRKLRIALERLLKEDQEEATIIMPQTLDSQHTPLPMIHDVTVGEICDHDTLGMIIGSYPDRYRVDLKDIIPIKYCSRIKVCKKKFRGV